MDDGRKFIGDDIGFATVAPLHTDITQSSPRSVGGGVSDSHTKTNMKKWRLAVCSLSAPKISIQSILSSIKIDIPTTTAASTETTPAESQYCIHLPSPPVDHTPLPLLNHGGR
jgi:hypothetical protein